MGGGLNRCCYERGCYDLKCCNRCIRHGGMLVYLLLFCFYDLISYSNSFERILLVW